MGITATNHRSSACGRTQLLDIQWGVHTFCLVNTYWPATGLSDRTLFLHDVLMPMLQGLTVALPQAWICGDFNFVPDTGRDRSPAPATDSPTAQGDVPTPRRVDATSTTPRPDCCHCRIPAGLLLDRLAARLLMAWVQEAVTCRCGLTLPHDDLISWWPRMQLCYKRVTRSAQATQAQQRRDATAATIATRAALETAMLAITSSTYAPHLAALQRAQEGQCALRDAAHAAAVATIHSTCLNWIRNKRPPLC